jgi:hypothetical protein
LEQCKHVYNDLVNQYKCLAKKIDERINWSKLDNTANQLSPERHKLNYRLKRLKEWQQKKEQEEQAWQRKKEQVEQAPKARGKNKSFGDQMEDLKQYKETHGHKIGHCPSKASVTNLIILGFERTEMTVTTTTTQSVELDPMSVDFCARWPR